MYKVNHEYECENGKVVFDIYQVRFDNILVCECERESEANNIARKLNSHDELVAALKYFYDAARFNKNIDPYAFDMAVCALSKE